MVSKADEVSVLMEFTLQWNAHTYMYTCVIVCLNYTCSRGKV